jgi:protein-L-isoaspartate(D-aspartate) O-methyltransferase
MYPEHFRARADRFRGERPVRCTGFAPDLPILRNANKPLTLCFPSGLRTPMLNFEQARLNMIEQQIRPWEVLDPRVLHVLNEVHRESFVPAEYRSLAFADLQIPLAHGQFMMQPKVEARLLQALELTGKERVLEIGTGSGYMTALLASVAAHVDTVDIFHDLTEQAKQRLNECGLSNISFAVGDGATGWPGAGPYDAIIITGSVPVIPEGYAQNLVHNGRLVLIAGRAPIMEALRINRVDADAWTTTSLFDTCLPPLVNAETPAEFVF